MAGEPTQANEERTAAAAGGGRLDAIDFWRGAILCTIFVNHIPGNLFERFTFRNFGYSDSSEAFVFISGMSLALAYGQRFAGAGRASVFASLARRALRLYAVHIALSLAGIAVFALGALVLDNPALMDVHGRDLVMEDPSAALIGLLSLGHQFGYFNILPLYVVMLGLAPAMLGLASRGIGIMLGRSLALYAVTRLTGLNVPSWPMRGAWFFDPFAWQLLMSAGVAAGLQLRRGWRPGGVVSALAALVVVLAAFCSTDGLSFWPGLDAAVRPLLDLDKTTLGLGRLVHFLSLACCAQTLLVGTLVRRLPCFAALCTMGRHGLPVFVLLSLLAAFGQVVTGAAGDPWPLDVLLVGGGVAALYGLAAHLQQRMPDLAPSRWVPAGALLRHR